MNAAETMNKYLETAFSRDKLLQELSNPECSFFFIYSDRILSGYLKLNEAPAQSDHNDPQSLEVERIYVRKEFQGKTEAIAFYGKMGFAVAGRHTFRMGDEIQGDQVMKKVLEY
jgi:ribosomal protein S18 acetylase RimI-like enzyme